MLEDDIHYLVALIQAVYMRILQKGRLTPEEKSKVLDTVLALLKKTVLRLQG